MDNNGKKFPIVPAARIFIVGVGGAGNNAVNRMIEADVKNAEFIAVNTDLQSLMMSTAPVKLQIGAKFTHGQGAGADPEIGQRAAEESKLALKEKMKDADMVFVTAGMGGGTGTGAAPVIAALAKEMGKLTVAVVTKPFAFEGRVRMDHAEIGIINLRKVVDTLVVVPNEKLNSIASGMAFSEAFKYADEVLRQCIQGITDVIMNPSIINLDFADICTVMRNSGIAHMCIGRGKGENKTMEAVRQAVQSPLLETSIEGATRVIMHLMVSPDTRLDEINQAAALVTQVVAPGANIIFGFDERDSLKDEIVVSIIATGFNKSTEEDENNSKASSGIEKKLGIFGVIDEEKKAETFVKHDDPNQYLTQVVTTSRIEVEDDFPEFLKKLSEKKVIDEKKD
jgi:cell division protein FtsZ